jgi:hypothetical protein
MRDSVNHTRFLKEDHIPDWVRRDKHSNKGECVNLNTIMFVAE